jgi:hypothetical protein
VTISASGSYRLTGNLPVPNENTDGIVVGATDVSIDLGGFTIRGPNQCSPPPVVCTLTGTGLGIHGSADGLRISNGGVVGMGSVGIYVESGDGDEIRNVRVAKNRFQGIRMDGAAALVERSTATRNGDDGVRVGLGGMLSNNVAYQNGSHGISENGSSTVSDNAVSQNGGNGILGSSGSIISGNTANGNAGAGIAAGQGSAVQRNTAVGNLIGITLQGRATYRENTILSNTAATVLGTLAVNMGDNSCDGTPTCP